MRYSALCEDLIEITEPVQVFENQSKLPHEPSVLEIFFKLWNKLGRKQRIVLWKTHHEDRINNKVVFCAMTASTGTSVSVKGLFEKKIASLGDQPLFRSWLWWTRLTGAKRIQINKPPLLFQWNTTAHNER